MKKALLKKIMTGLVSIVLISISFMLPSCREYDGRFDIAYFFKTGPEKAVVDFLQCLDNKDPEYIYSNLMLASDRNGISREKYNLELTLVLEDVESIAVNSTVYLGYEGEMGKVVAEFDIKYYNGESRQYKKYFYLLEENGRWKIILEKTFI
jgi:hypothetical protein